MKHIYAKMYDNTVKARRREIRVYYYKVPTL